MHNSSTPKQTLNGSGVLFLERETESYDVAGRSSHRRDPKLV